MTSKAEEKIEIGLHNTVLEKYSQSPSTLTDPKSSKDYKSDDDDPDTMCGFGSWTPEWIQKAAKPKLFLFFYSMVGITEGATYTYFIGCISTMEKRFSYDTTMSSSIIIATEIGSVLLGIFVGYFGGLAHRPRILTYGMLMGALGCFVTALPYFVYGPGHLDENLQRSTTNLSGVNTEFCDKDLNGKGDSCSKLATISVVAFFFIGNFLKSIAVVFYYSIGPSYIDDNTKKKNSPLYFSTIFTFRLLGPVVGFLLSSLCLQFYEDPFYDPGFGTKDPRWIGAWWLGFIILGILTFIFSTPMILFPKRFPKNKLPSSLQKKKLKEESKSAIQQLKDMVKAVKRLVKNPILMSHYIGAVFRLNGLTGFYFMLPKYMEMQFRQSASVASLFSGPSSITAMQLGMMLGGIAIRKFLPGPRALTGGIVIAEFFAVIGFVCCMLITCPVDQMVGTSTAASQLYILENECNADCMCTTKEYTPVCGPDSKSTYFSPCFAGCKGHNKTGKTEVFMDCKCVHDEGGKFTVGDSSKDYCEFECQWLITYVVILCVWTFLSSSATVGNAIVTLRCVKPEDKSIALGASALIFSLFAFVPYPLIYGALTDSSCVVWEESCGKTGNCWIYDTDKFRYLLHGVSAAFVFMGCVTDVFVWILSPRLRDLYADDDDEKDRSSEDIVEARGTNGDCVMGVINMGIVNDSTHSLNDKPFLKN